MESNRVKKIHDLGQSIWLDFFDRNIMNTWILKKLIEDNGISGITSNPSIFKKAISNSSDYDDDITALTKHKNSNDDIFFGLVVKDIKRATDFFNPVYGKPMGMTAL